MLSLRSKWKFLEEKKLIFFRCITKGDFSFYQKKGWALIIWTPLAFCSLRHNLMLMETIHSFKEEKNSYIYIMFHKIFTNFRFFYYYLRFFWLEHSRGYVNKLKIKGFGRRVWQSNRLLWFKLGHSHRVLLGKKKWIRLTVHKKKTVLRGYSPSSSYLFSFMEKIRKLKITFDYKDVGIRFLKKKARLKKRRING